MADRFRFGAVRAMESERFSSPCHESGRLLASARLLFLETLPKKIDKERETGSKNEH
jgi:hypothetical protein